MNRTSRSGRAPKGDVNPGLVILYIFITVVIGIICFIVTELFYNAATGNMWRPLSIGLYFLIFGILYYIAYFLINSFSGTLNSGGRRGGSSASAKTANRTSSRRKTQTNRVTRSTGTRRGGREGSSSSEILTPILIVAGVAVGFFAVSMLFEFLYELGKQKSVEPSSYIFVIDDSGSMASTDPQDKRVKAISDIMADADPDMEYAVYSFTSVLTMLKDMSPWSPSDSYAFSSWGNTDIIGALSGVLDDLESGRIDGGDHPRILLLSDGQSSSFGKSNIVERCRKNGASISTVSFPDSNSLLRYLAEKTGGIYIDSNDTIKLGKIMEEAVTFSSSRDLLSYRFMSQSNGLYAFLRILFLVILGIIWSGFKYVISSSTESDIPSLVVFIVSAVLCVIAAVFMEVSSQAYSSITPRFLFVLLWAISFGQLMIQTARKRRSHGGRSLS
ncbi:MAG: VWA domain-containing protein [Clostridiales bacterium]|nr:VWA domain-containing protein [Clostridiales bacterium]